MFIFITIRKYFHKMVTFVMGIFSICLQVSFTCCVIKTYSIMYFFSAWHISFQGKNDRGSTVSSVKAC